MNIEQVRSYCLSFPGATEDMPFGDDALVFKVGGKMFCMAVFGENVRINIKADPEVNLERRENYSSVIPGYHMDKKHWNTITVDGEVPTEELRAWIEESYRIVWDKLPLKIKNHIESV